MTTKNRIQRSALVLAFAASTLALSACAGVGPARVPCTRRANPSPRWAMPISPSQTLDCPCVDRVPKGAAWRRRVNKPMGVSVWGCGAQGTGGWAPM